MHYPCPKCESAQLQSVSGASSISSSHSRPRQCPGCRGVWVPFAAFAALEDEDFLAEHDSPAGDAEYDRRIGACPEGHGMMRRARVQWDDTYFLDRCGSCGGIWFDAGEWSRIANERLLENITEIWTLAYRSRRTQERVDAALGADLQQKLGEDTFALLLELAKKLHGHPHASAAAAYLRHLLREES